MLKQTITKQDKPRHVLISNEAVLYNVKAPFEKSGVSIKGGLEYDPEDDTVRCHECGEWMKSLAPHLKTHDLDSKEYKLKHGLFAGSALVNEKIRKKCIEVGLKLVEENSKVKQAFIDRWRKKHQRGKRPNSPFFKSRARPEGKNVNMLCVPQLLDKFKTLAKELGRTPNSTDLERARINVKTVHNTFGSLTAAMKLAGLMPNRQYAATPIKYDFNSQALVGILRNFYSLHKRVPTSSDARRGLIPPVHVFVRECGSWRNAVLKSGLPLENRFNKGLSKQQVLKRLKQFVKGVGRVPITSHRDDSLRKKYGLPHPRFLSKEFGSWNNFLQAGNFKPIGKGHTIKET